MGRMHNRENTTVGSLHYPYALIVGIYIHSKLTSRWAKSLLSHATPKKLLNLHNSRVPKIVSPYTISQCAMLINTWERQLHYVAKLKSWEEQSCKAQVMVSNSTILHIHTWHKPLSGDEAKIINLIPCLWGCWTCIVNIPSFWIQVCTIAQVTKCCHRDNYICEGRQKLAYSSGRCECTLLYSWFPYLDKDC